MYTSRQLGSDGAPYILASQYERIALSLYWLEVEMNVAFDTEKPELVGGSAEADVATALNCKGSATL